MSSNTDHSRKNGDLPESSYKKTKDGFQLTFTTPSGDSVEILFSDSEKEPKKDAAE